MRGLFHTNILVDFLKGSDDARREMSRFDERLISIVTWMEVMVGTSSEDDTAVAPAVVRRRAYRR